MLDVKDNINKYKQFSYIDKKYMPFSYKSDGRETP